MNGCDFATCLFISLGGPTLQQFGKAMDDYAYIPGNDLWEISLECMVEYIYEGELQIMTY